jgi:hypothetical protein
VAQAGQNSRRRRTEAFIEKQSTPLMNDKMAPERKSPAQKAASGLKFLERETGLEPATSTLARWKSQVNPSYYQLVLHGILYDVTRSTSRMLIGI